jgi:Ca-activated chloride channel homolog
MHDAVHDFGILARADQRYADFRIRNDGDREEIIFRVEVPREVEVKMSSKRIAPGATESIRLQYNPAQSGPFSIEAKVFASAWAEPRIVKLTGETTFAESGVPCPDFGDAPTGERPFHVSIRDIEMKSIPEANLRLYKDGRAVAAQRSNSSGEATFGLMPGRYFIVAHVNGVEMDTVIYTSAMRDHVLLVLPQNREQIGEVTTLTPRSQPAARIPTGESRTITPQPAEEEPAEEKLPQPLAPMPTGAVLDLDQDNDLMPLALYKQNNVVFLVDVSTSMKQQGRLDLLKIAMTDLLEAMRGVDRFTLISYSTNTALHFEADQGFDREVIAQAIMSLQAGGSTEGAKALDRAGRAARKHFLPEGNNQIILATDGAFNEGAKEAIRYVSRYRRLGIHTSVLCIRCGKFTTDEMQALTGEGAGRFIPIDGASDAGAQLIEEIKTSALR